MNKHKWIMLVLALALMAGAGGFLGQLSKFQRLGEPGVKTHPLQGTKRLEVEVPNSVPDYQCEILKPDDVVLGTLPADTSFGRGQYRAADGFLLQVNVVLMGTDRTSMHKPQICLVGNGFQIDQSDSKETFVHVERPLEYDLPVVKLVGSREVTVNGHKTLMRGIYVYWYVAGDAMSASVTGLERMWWMARKLFTTGVLQRWAYISCLGYCAPGQEDATFERMKKFIAASVPQFQLYPKGPPTTVAAQSDARPAIPAR